VHKVEINALSFNERAIHLYQKLGFILEGRKREVFYINRKYHDSVQFGMLESEWKKLRGVE
jgi:RimJ/RimL family protein N-acetyltransferase